MRKDERELAERIAGEVRRRRLALGWAQLALAEHAALSLNYVGMLERAERLPSFEVLLRIARALGATVGELVSGGDIAPEGDPWLTEASALLRALPTDARPVAIGMLRAVIEATAPKGAGSGVRPKRRRGR
jgi:transcriptional regulator with XRE-family HTH domain